MPSGEFERSGITVPKKITVVTVLTIAVISYVYGVGSLDDIIATTSGSLKPSLERHRGGVESRDPIPGAGFSILAEKPLEQSVSIDSGQRHCQLAD